MKNGKKNTVRKIVNKALKKASLKLPVKDIHTILHTAIYNLSPDIELKSKFFIKTILYFLLSFVPYLDLAFCLFTTELKSYLPRTK